MSLKLRDISEKISRSTFEQKILAVGLLIAIGLSLYSHSLVFKEFIMPTYGNVMVHVAVAQDMVNSGFYPFEDYSYGGGIPNLYVPGYRLVIAHLVLLTGLSIDLASRLLVVLFALLLPLGFFVLGRSLLGPRAGVLCALFASLAPELLIYTIRPLPQAMGLAILPVAFWALLKNHRAGALAFGIGLALIHQEALLFLAVVALAYGIAHLAYGRLGFTRDRSAAITAILTWLAIFVVYLSWHFAIIGNLNFWDLAQFKYHEGAPVSWDFFFGHTGAVLSWLGFAGGAIALLSFASTAQARRHWHEGLFLLVGFGVGIFFIKNDVVGLRVFMDRFLVYAQLFIIPIAAFAVLQLVRFAGWLGQQNPLANARF